MRKRKSENSKKIVRIGDFEFKSPLKGRKWDK